jgi:hypothetical protein
MKGITADQIGMLISLLGVAMGAWLLYRTRGKKPASVAKTIPTGYVVVSVANLYLDRHFAWRRHPSCANAYVHSPDILWRRRSYLVAANHVLRARYNPDTDSTEIVDPKPIGWFEFLFQEDQRR